MLAQWYVKLDDNPLKGFGQDSCDTSVPDSYSSSTDDPDSVKLAPPSMVDLIDSNRGETNPGHGVPGLQSHQPSTLRLHLRRPKPIKLPVIIWRSYLSIGNPAKEIDHLKIDSAPSEYTVEEKHRLRKSLECMVFLRLRLRHWAKSIMESRYEGGGIMINYVLWAKTSETFGALGA